MFQKTILASLVLASTIYAATPSVALTGNTPQSNYCGNGVTSYCCTGPGSCTAMGTNSICSTTVVCCNANDTIDICLGSITGNLNIYIDIGTLVEQSGPCNCGPFQQKYHDHGNSRGHN